MTASLDLLLVLLMVAVESPAAPPPSPELTHPRARFVTPLDGSVLYKPAYDNCAEGSNASVMVTFMPDGTITNLELEHSSGNRDVDRAIFMLLRKQRMEASDKGGIGIVRFSLDDIGPSTPRDRVRECDIMSKPSLDAVVRARSKVAGVAAKARLVITWKRGIVVRSTVVESVGNSDVDAAIESWGRGLRMVPGRKGQGYVDVEIPDGLVGDAP